MIRMDCSRWFAPLLAGALFAPAAQAQQASTPDEIPAELVLALIPSFGAGRTTAILVEAAPDSIARYLPADARVVGSVIATNGAMTLARTDRPVREAVEEVLAGLRAAGWTEIPQREQRGFVTTNLMAGAGVLCRDQDEAANVTVRRAGGQAYLRVQRMRVGRSNQVCDPDFGRAGASPFEQYPMPTLEAPAGARSRGGGSSRGSDGFSTRAVIETDISPGELVDHFADQLGRQGWRWIAGPDSDELVGVQLWERVDEAGERWRAVLTVAALDAQRHSATFDARLLGGRDFD